MKLEYKIVILSVTIGILFLLAEMLSRFISENSYVENSTGAVNFLFEPLTTDQSVFLYLSILLLCLIFGVMLARMIRQVLKAKDAARQTDIEKNVVLDSVPEIVMYVNKDYRIRWASQSLYTETGMRKEDLVERYLDDVTKNLFEAELVDEQFKILKAKKTLDIELNSKKGKYWQILSNPATDENGNNNGYVFLAIDITRNKRDEEMKRRSYEQLENNIEQFATVIDNIRNPLSSVVLLAETFENTEISDQIIRQCGDIEEVISRLDEGWANSEDIRNFLKKHL